MTLFPAKHVSVLFLADVAKIPGDDLPQVKEFVSKGGLLIRFAGERTTNGTDDLVPVRLRVGGRYLGSAMAWGQPQHLAPFSAQSPFNGLEVPSEVTVTRQVLAEPASDVQNKNWAQLADGTPLITAGPLGQGWVVMFHITASPTWSSLPLSGLYVDMLKRLLALSAGTPVREMAGLTSLPPVSLLDGFGHPEAPTADTAPIASREFSRTRVSPRHPPGLYGAHEVESALNVMRTGDRLSPLTGASQAYANAHAKPLESYLLAAAMLLLLLDAIIALGLRGFSPRKMRWLGAGVALFVLMPLVSLRGARADDAMNMKAALDTRLAYVKTGLPDVDSISQAGLTGLGLAPQGPHFLRTGRSGGRQSRDRRSVVLSAALLADGSTREKSLAQGADPHRRFYAQWRHHPVRHARSDPGAVAGPDSAGQQTLRRLTAGLDFPPLEQVPADHVLTKAFYLLRDFPGRWTGSKLWVEAIPPAPNNGAPPARARRWRFARDHRRQ